MGCAGMMHRDNPHAMFEGLTHPYMDDDDPAKV